MVQHDWNGMMAFLVQQHASSMSGIMQGCVPSDTMQGCVPLDIMRGCVSSGIMANLWVFRHQGLTQKAPGLTPLEPLMQHQ